MVRYVQRSAAMRLYQFIVPLLLSACALDEVTDPGDSSPDDDAYGTVDESLTRASNLRGGTSVPCVDPGITREGATWVLFCGGQEDHFWTSRDLSKWESHKMTITPPSWMVKDSMDEKSKMGGYQPTKIRGKFYVYFSALDEGNPSPETHKHHKSIGVLSVPSGGFVDKVDSGPLELVPSGPTSQLPLVQQMNESVQDSFVLQDKGRLYIYYNRFNSDKDSNKSDSGIYVNSLSAPDVAVQSARELLRAHLATQGKGTKLQAWTGNTAEAPAVVKHGRFYYLFFSGNEFKTSQYETGVARSSSPTRGFVEYPKDSDRPPFYYPQLTATRMQREFKLRDDDNDRDHGVEQGPGSISISHGRVVFNAKLEKDEGRMLYTGTLETNSDGWLYIK